MCGGIDIFMDVQILRIQTGKQSSPITYYVMSSNERSSELVHMLPTEGPFLTSNGSSIGLAQVLEEVGRQL